MSYITCIQRHCSIQFKKNIQVAKFIDWSEHGKFLSAHVLQVHVVTCRLHYSSPLTHTPSSLCCLPPQLQINLLPHLCLLQLTIFIFFSLFRLILKWCRECWPHHHHLPSCTCKCTHQFLHPSRAKLPWPSCGPMVSNHHHPTAGLMSSPPLDIGHLC